MELFTAIMLEMHRPIVSMFCFGVCQTQSHF